MRVDPYRFSNLGKASVFALVGVFLELDVGELGVLGRGNRTRGVRVVVVGVVVLREELDRPEERLGSFELRRGGSELPVVLRPGELLGSGLSRVLRPEYVLPRVGEVVLLPVLPETGLRGAGCTDGLVLGRVGRVEVDRVLVGRVGVREMVGVAVGRRAGLGVGRETVGRGAGRETVGRGAGRETVGRGAGRETVGRGAGRELWVGRALGRGEEPRPLWP